MITLLPRSNLCRLKSPDFSFSCGSLSKTALIRWAFALCKEEREATVAAKAFAALQTAGLSSADSLTRQLWSTLKPVESRLIKPTTGGPTVVDVTDHLLVDRGAFVHVMSITHAKTVSQIGNQDVSLIRRRSGVKLPNWKSLVLRGLNATTPMTGTLDRFSYVPGFQFVKMLPLPGTYEELGQFGPVSMAVPETLNQGNLVSVVDTRAIAKLHDKLYAIQHDADIGETLGEFRQALDMFGKPLQGMHDLIELYKRRSRLILTGKSSTGRINAVDAEKAQKSLASLWLEFNFGWKPLVHDLIDVYKAAVNRRDAVKTSVKVSFKGDVLVSDSTFANLDNSYLWTNIRTKKSVTTSVRYQVGINPKKVDLLSFAERIGITPTRFIPTAYAVLPYSWLLDYFVGINTLLDALCDSFEFVTWQSKTTRSEHIVERLCTPDFARSRLATPNFKEAGGAPSSSRATRVVVTREIPTNLIPPLTLTVPVTWRPWANMAALAAQRKMLAADAARVISAYARETDLTTQYPARK